MADLAKASLKLESSGEPLKGSAAGGGGPSSFAASSELKRRGEAKRFARESAGRSPSHDHKPYSRSMSWRGHRLKGGGEEAGDVKAERLSAKGVVADRLTKPLIDELLYKLCDLLLGYATLREGRAAARRHWATPKGGLSKKASLD